FIVQPCAWSIFLDSLFGYGWIRLRDPLPKVFQLVLAHLRPASLTNLGYFRAGLGLAGRADVGTAFSCTHSSADGAPLRFRLSEVSEAWRHVEFLFDLNHDASDFD